MTAAFASENGDFEASFEELVEDGWAKIASGLRCILVSVFEDSTRRGVKRRALQRRRYWKRLSYSSQSDFGDTVHLIGRFLVLQKGGGGR